MNFANTLFKAAKMLNDMHAAPSIEYVRCWQCKGIISAARPCWVCHNTGKCAVEVRREP